MFGARVSKETCLDLGMSEKAYEYYHEHSLYVTMKNLCTKIGAGLILDNKSYDLPSEKACGTHMRADVALGRLQLVFYGKRSSELGFKDHQDFDYWKTNLYVSYLTSSERETHLRALGTKEGVDLLAKCKYCCVDVKPVSAAKLALDVTGNLGEATKFVLQEQALVGMDPDLKELTEEWDKRLRAHEKRKEETNKRERDSTVAEESAKRAKASR